MLNDFILYVKYKSWQIFIEIVENSERKKILIFNVKDFMFYKYIYKYIHKL